MSSSCIKTKDLDETEFDKIFSLLDLDGNQTISISEMYSYLKTVLTFETAEPVHSWLHLTCVNT